MTGPKVRWLFVRATPPHRPTRRAVGPFDFIYCHAPQPFGLGWTNSWSFAPARLNAVSIPRRRKGGQAMSETERGTGHVGRRFPKSGQALSNASNNEKRDISCSSVSNTERSERSGRPSFLFEQRLDTWPVPFLRIAILECSQFFR